jgi:hypothetical protein
MRGYERANGLVFGGDFVRRGRAHRYDERDDQAMDAERCERGFPPLSLAVLQLARLDEVALEVHPLSPS